MGKTFVASLGFDPSSIIRLIGERGLSEGDRIVLVTSAVHHPRAESALRSVEDLVNRINPKVEVEVLRLDEKAFVENIVALTKLVESSENPVVDVSGGPKMIAFSLFLAACFSGRVGAVYMTTETTGERIEVPTIAVPRHALSDRQAEVLSLLPARVSELSRRLGLSKSTVSKVLSSLESKGLAYRRSDRAFEPTLAGVVLRSLLRKRGS